MGKRDRRSEIMQATEKLFATRRFHEITLDDVIREAGVGKGTVYRYFKDKDDLFFQTAIAGFDEMCALIEDTSPGDAPFDRQLLDVCQQVAAFSQKRRSLFRMMQSEESRVHGCRGRVRKQWMTHREKLVTAMAGVLARGAAEGLIRNDIDPAVLARVLLSALRTHSRELSESLGERRGLQTIVELFLGGAGFRASVDQTIVCVRRTGA